MEALIFWPYCCGDDDDFEFDAPLVYPKGEVTGSGALYIDCGSNLKI